MKESVRKPTIDSVSGESQAETPPSGAVVLLASVAALGGFLFGYDSAVINGAVSAIGAQFSAGAAALGLTLSSALLGAAAGALTAGRVADQYGRLHAMRLAAILFLISAIGSGLANSLLVLAIFRVVGGVAVGIASVIAPACIAEIAPQRSADGSDRCSSLPSFRASFSRCWSTTASRRLPAARRHRGPLDSKRGAGCSSR